MDLYIVATPHVECYGGVGFKVKALLFWLKIYVNPCTTIRISIANLFYLYSNLISIITAGFVAINELIIDSKQKAKQKIFSVTCNVTMQPPLKDIATYS